MLYTILSVYLIVINALALLLMLIDKEKAKKNLWRISEKVLLLFALLGGSLGSLLGMRFFHHKTKKPLFFLGVPTILILQLMLAIWIYTKI